MDWKKYIPEEEHHLYEDNEITSFARNEETTYSEEEKPHLYEVGSVIKYERIHENKQKEEPSGTETIDDLILERQHSTAQAIRRIGDVTNRPYTALMDFARNNIPEDYRNKPNEFLQNIRKLYAKTLNNESSKKPIEEADNETKRILYEQIVNLNNQ